MQETCENEPAVVAALHLGTWTFALDEHVAACARCAETREVAGLFLRHAERSRKENHPVVYAVAWRKLQEDGRRHALRPAMQSLWAIVVLVSIYFGALTIWFLQALWRTHRDAFSDVLPALSNRMLCGGIVVALTSVVVGSGCLLYMGRRGHLQQA